MEDNSIPVAPIFFLDENPENNIVAAPDGRVFVNLELVVSDMTMQLILKAIAASAKGDEKELLRIDGARGILSAFLQTSDGVKQLANAERETGEVNEEARRLIKEGLEGTNLNGLEDFGK